MAESDGDQRDPAAKLRERQLRATPQRQAILEAFAGGPGEHLSAEEVHARAAARAKGLGRGTVYATLADLSEVGLLGSVGDQDPIRYETNTDPHEHFRCRLCLRLIDVEVDPPALGTLTEAGYLVEAVAVMVEGVCRDCQAYARGLHDGTRAIARKSQLGEAELDRVTAVCHETDLGTLLLAASSDGVARIAFPGQADFEGLRERARSRRGGRGGRSRADDLAHAVAGYLSGEREPLADGIDWDLVGDGGRLSFEAVQRVAWGERRSYHEVCDPGLTPYDCGYALGTNPVPILVPCHRVTRGAEMSVDYVAGMGIRDRLDRLEHPV